MSSMEDRELELQLIDLFNKVASWGHAMSRDEFMEMVNKGAVDHQEAAHEAMQLIKARDERREVEIADKNHLIGFKNGKWAATRRLNDIWTQLMIDEVGSEKAFAYRDAIVAELEQSLTKKEEAK